MRPSAPPQLGVNASPAGEALPHLPSLFERIEGTLWSRGGLGLLSITVLQRRNLEPAAGWPAYEAMVGEIARFLGAEGRRSLRRGDLAFQAGVSGNAFVLLLEPPRQERPVEAADLARVRWRLRRALAAHLRHALPQKVCERFGCYVGATILRPSDDVQVERLVYRGLEEAFASALREKERLVRRHLVHLRKILDHELLHAVYQPIVDVEAGGVVGLEALTRVPPARFDTVELLFQTALENDALWSLERLCRRKALEGLPALRPDQFLFLNVDPNSLQDPDLLADGFLGQVERAGLRPQRVVLEITEHSAVHDFVSFRRTLTRFRALGFQLAMDDVGSGYAGLQSIAEIVPDYIKADMALVRGVHANPLKRELIATIRRFADSTGIRLIAEGVELPAELEALRDAGVRWAQGYLFARPSPAPSELAWDPGPPRD